MNILWNYTLAIRDSTISNDPETANILTQWHDPGFIPNADSWTFDVFDFVKKSRGKYLVKLAGYVLGIFGGNLYVKNRKL